MKTEMQKLLDGEPYYPGDPEVTDAIRHVQLLCEELDRISIADEPARAAKVREIFGSVGSNVCMLSPLCVELGIRTFIGDNFFSNRNLSLIDQGGIVIGNDCMFGPNVTVVTSNHPIDPEARKTNVVINKTVRIGNNVWLCANSLILPGVTVGDNAVVAAGAVVTKDVPPNTVVAGNPAKVVKTV
jgi:maltose O-acetyltransferase